MGLPNEFILLHNLEKRNCFFHAVGEQLRVEHAKVRAVEVKFLRENSKMNREEWSAFVEEGE